MALPPGFDVDIAVRVNGGATGVRDLAGNPLTSDLTFTVHTESSPTNPGLVRINELCADPLQDWGDTAGGDGLRAGDERQRLRRRCDHRLRLADGQQAFLAEHHPVAIKQHTPIGPHIEVAEPELFVDQRKQLVDSGAPVLGDPDVRQAQQLKHVVFGPPDAAQLIGQREMQGDRTAGSAWRACDRGRPRRRSP